MNSTRPEFLDEPERYELDEPACWDFDRREFFRIAGGGLVVALLLGESPRAQPPGRGGARGGGQAARELSAWLHIGEDGQIGVFTGKTEIGQNIRTSLSQVVAEELHVPAGRIRLVMADTQRVPFDGGTAGSRTTPDMAAQLRRVAATAREALIDLAAAKAKLDRGQFSVSDGTIAGPGGQPSLTFAELTRGKQLMKVVGAEAATTPAAKWTVAGTSVPKVDGRAFVTGGHRFASDTHRPNMLIGRVLRPPGFKAKLISVDLSRAERDGVTVVRDRDFVGVAAPDEQLAAKALAAIAAAWDVPLQPSSQELFRYLKEHPSSGRGARGGGFGGGGGGGSAESVAAGLRAADVQLPATYTIAYIAHVPLEPRAAVAEWADGKLTVWTGTQRPFGVRGELAAVFGIPADRVRVIVPDMGSGYGGKHTGEAAVEAARLAKAAGKPVKLVWSREEEFTWAYFRPAGLIEISSGVKRDGTITAWEFHNYNSGGSSLRTPYQAGGTLQEFHATETPLRQGSYRALASTANTFARESHMDDLAHALGQDPLAFRLRNLTEPRLRGVLEAGTQRFGWTPGKAQTASGRGVGLALGTDKGSFVATCAEVAVDKSSGRVKVLRLVTAFDCGAVLNPAHLTNQIEGAGIMALGGALFESIEFAQGQILNPKLSAYRVPRFQDAPRMETVLVGAKEQSSAGAGETPLIAVAPAIGNAIFQATGKRVRSLPMKVPT